MAKGRDSFAMRFPDGLRERLKIRAVLNRRTMSAEVVLAVEHWLSRAETVGQRVSTGKADRLGEP